MELLVVEPELGVEPITALQRASASADPAPSRCRRSLPAIPSLTLNLGDRPPIDWPMRRDYSRRRCVRRRSPPSRRRVARGRPGAEVDRNIRSWLPASFRVGTSGQAPSGQGASNGVIDWSCHVRACASARSPAAGRGSRRLRHPPPRRSTTRGWRELGPLRSRARSAPQALKVSPGIGIIALSRTRRSTRRRAQTIGAVKPPIDAATRMTSARSSIASTTASADSDQLAASSSAGSRTASLPAHGTRARRRADATPRGRPLHRESGRRSPTLSSLGNRAAYGLSR